MSTEFAAFFRQFRDRFHSTGSIVPSGRALARALARWIGHRCWELPVGAGVPVISGREHPGRLYAALPLRLSAFALRILEIGPGTGAVTAEILRRMGAHDALDLVEANEHFVAFLERRFATLRSWRRHRPRVRIWQGHLEDFAAEQPYDVVISGLPLNNFDAGTVARILDAYRRLTAPHGVLSFFEYIYIRRLRTLRVAPARLVPAAQRERLLAISRQIEPFLAAHCFRRDWVYANLPPAWVHHVRFGCATDDGHASP